MLFVLPVSHADLHLIEPLVEVFQKFGGLQEHKALVVTSAKTGEQGEKYAAAIRPLFGKTECLIFPTDPNPGWPQACNQYFKLAAFHVERFYGEPFWWFEADCTPLKASWANEIVMEYLLSQKPFMGVKNETWFTRRGVPYQDGHHMVGTGIYPGKLSQFSKLYQYAIDEPWDVFSRWEIAPKMHETIKIQHNWGTGNYKKIGKGGTITVCEQVKKPTHHNYNAAVKKTTMVLHGCRDNSIRDIVLGRDPLRLTLETSENIDTIAHA